MRLSLKLSSAFPSPVVTKGAVLLANDGVVIAHSDRDSLEADVYHGKQTQMVSLELRAEPQRYVLLTWCSCRTFESGRQCEHIWATIEAADEKNWGAKALRSGLPIKVEAEIDDFGVDFMETLDEAIPPRRANPSVVAFSPQAAKSTAPPKSTSWKQLVKNLSRAVDTESTKPLPTVPMPREVKRSEIWYALDLSASLASEKLVIDLFHRETRAGGEWGLMKPLKLYRAEIDNLGDEEDRGILGLLFGSESGSDPTSIFSPFYNTQFGLKTDNFKVPVLLYESLLPRLAASKRLSVVDNSNGRPEASPLTFEVDPWQFNLAIKRPESKPTSSWSLSGQLRRGHETIPLSAPKLLMPRLVLQSDKLAPLEPLSQTTLQWIAHLRQHGEVTIPDKDLDQFVASVTALPGFPGIIWESESAWKDETGEPSPRLSVQAPSTATAGNLIARVFFDYGHKTFAYRDQRDRWVTDRKRTLWRRNHEAERDLFSQLVARHQIERVPSSQQDVGDVIFPVTELSGLCSALSEQGWILEAEGRRLRKAGNFRLKVASGIDWFDLGGECDFDGQTLDLPALLEARARGDNIVRLGDGTLGILPAEWLAKLGQIERFGDVGQDGVRFRRPQIALLDALLDEMPSVKIDQTFARLQGKIRSFTGITAKDPGPNFQGDLREYQREGLGWLSFLKEFGFGGCLADDMGLGKTVQILAMLQEHHSGGRKKGGAKASLLVLPRSLVQNWLDEAKRFCPDLRLLDYSQVDRHNQWDELDRHDVVLTTYGILRRDIERFRAHEFDYAILDEAQAIKNQDSQIAKVARLIRAQHRLALSGTPVENHLGELGSIFEFLNPGMLRPELLSDLSKKDPDDSRQSVALLSKALRPFILRRTKEQVLRDLPPKTEQTLYCELERSQRKLYEELRKHYQAKLNKTIVDKGMAGSKIQILEALLRLRQAACHPGLVDQNHAKGPSAKLEILLEHLQEIAASGHKALVFSQFTSMLAFVRERLAKAKIAYEYLDGSTRDRQGKVNRFQTDPKVPVFLISLKAGGVGLNLTAADYCFILDPWWNPAAEAQAIDRAHRMGQTKKVFAYRLIAKNTVEEKILALQEKKRGLAEAIVSADNSVLRSLTLDDVQLLLS